MSEETEKDPKKKLILQIEDEIIVKFCEFNGGMEFAMPIIRKQYDKYHVDFKNPTRDELEKIVETLIEVTQNLKGDIVAREERKCFKELLKKLD